MSVISHRLVRIKMEARRKREQREQQELMARMEKARRDDAVASQYKDWDVGIHHDKVELALVGHS